MKTELEKFIEWLEGYNEFCYDNSKDLVFDTFGENKVLSESAKKFYSQGLATLLTKGLEFDTVVILNAHDFKCPKHLYVALTRAKEKKLIEAQKDETIRFVSWLCNTNKIQDILEHKKTETELYEQWISKT